MTSSSLSLDGGAVSFDTPANARSSIQAIDASLEMVSATRGEIDAGVKRISSVVSNLTDSALAIDTASGR